MQKIGILYCGYNTEEYVDQSIQPWINARADKLMGCEFVICAVSVPFLEYKDDNFRDGTTEALNDYYKNFKIDHLITEPQYVLEHIARDNALQYLLSQGIDSLILVDADEIWEESQIKEILGKVCLDKFTSWFSVQYRNFVFDKQTHLVDYFTPPRIFRVETNGYKLLRFNWDNDTVYGTDCFEFNKNCRKEVPHRELPHKLIRGTAINHYSWIGETAKRKIFYQQAHFQGVCSYKWDDINGLSFNEDYYKKLGQKVPEVVKL